MKGKIALEECWTIPETFQSFNPSQFAGKGVIGDDLNANLLDVHGKRLQEMDENDVEFMVLSLNAPGVQNVTDPAAAEKLAEIANDKIEAEVLKDPKRFAAFAALSMHDPAQAGRELRRCMTEKKGFVGAMLNDFQSSGPDGNTMLFYDDPKYDEFWKVAHELKAPVYLHPRTSSPLIKEMMWKGRPWLDFSALGYANRLNMHTLGIITGGVLDRFPDLKIIIGHMGEHIPYDLYRIDHKLDRSRFPNMPMRKDRLVRDYFGTQVFITTSGHFSTPALICAMTEIGARSICFSIDYPFESIPNGCCWWDEHVSPVVNERDFVDMGRNNALQIFPRLTEGLHGLKEMGPAECGVGGLRAEDGEVTFGMYNKDFNKRGKKMYS
ncbi:uncharacterized protein Z519_10413 [Cladophialophora bantiana CBS 173.52]|uniref:Amidohydrolase-related domain-containing protein n=1 Tax=Cladophialophora bantiana (strain ATCC 10958 / CBS 173.52 / CDC B-1940 / NIH 8579) TaxID=1442370 RepID=A0A0D2HWK3_CLAB1|nr:uncharacterized protein Z519_10413 [Cladophialophora bantiana CBS 173.52]KIW88929.1 hypothetical protein Z519_10413 [Cladophialophora bantiana CBS 173.52]